MVTLRLSCVWLMFIFIKWNNVSQHSYKQTAGWGTVVSSWEMDCKNVTPLILEEGSKLIHFRFKSLRNLTWYSITILTCLSSSTGNGLPWKFMHKMLQLTFTRESWFTWESKENFSCTYWKAHSNKQLSWVLWTLEEVEVQSYRRWTTSLEGVEHISVQIDGVISH